MLNVAIIIPYVKQIILKNYYVICKIIIFTSNFSTFKFLDFSSSHSFIVGMRKYSFNENNQLVK